MLPAPEDVVVQPHREQHVDVAVVHALLLQDGPLVLLADRPLDLPVDLGTLERRFAVTVGISPGELLDKISILELKAERISDLAWLSHVLTKLASLKEARQRSIFDHEEVADLTVELKAINDALWRIEDEIREREEAGDFGPRFVELARSVYQTNDRRAAVKRRINERLGSARKSWKRSRMPQTDPPPRMCPPPAEDPGDACTCPDILAESSERISGNS